jgi:hypothetical protein
MTFSGFASAGVVSPWCDGFAKNFDSEGDDDGVNDMDDVVKLRRLRKEMYKKSESRVDVQ